MNFGIILLDNNNNNNRLLCYKSRSIKHALYSFFKKLRILLYAFIYGLVCSHAKRRFGKVDFRTDLTLILYARRCCLCIIVFSFYLAVDLVHSGC